jgi:hypothetical protein
VSCLDVRDRLSEFVLGLLAGSGARDVQRHLEWCPGCRKEAEELQEGVASVALGLPFADPPSSLEHRVVDRVQAAAGRRRSAPHSGFRLLVVATFTAVMLALGALAWGVHETNRTASQQEAFHNTIDRLTEVISGSASRVADLTPTRSASPQGRALVYSSPKSDDLVFVDVFPAQAGSGPYRFQLYDRAGRVISGGKLSRTSNGDFLFYDISSRDLSGATSATVLDARGNAVLIGRLHPTTAG